MALSKIQGVQLVQGENNSAPLYVTSEIRSLIGELLIPRIDMLQKIVSTSMVTEAQNDGDQDGDGWWPDYSISSNLHYMTEMNGLIHLAQKAIKGMREELVIIADKFQSFMMEYCKERQPADKSPLISPPVSIQFQFGRYLLAQSLIKDLIEFVSCCDRHFSKLQAERIQYSDRAEATKSTEDRIRLKVFDERCFSQLHKRTGNLKNFMHEFCELFGSKQIFTKSTAKQRNSDVLQITEISK